MLARMSPAKSLDSRPYRTIARLSHSCAIAVAMLLPPVASGAQPGVWLRQSSEPIDLPNGSRVEFNTVPSEAVGGEGRYSVYFPPSYAKNTEARYPVVYFLHGLFNDHTSWTIDRHGDIPRMVDEKMATGELPEMLLVFPDGGRSFYTDFKDGSMAYERFVVEELPRHIEASYRVKSGRGARAIAGTSMGGYGALKIAMRFPDRYAAVAAHSPIVFPVKNPLDVPESAKQGRQYQYLSRIFNRVYGDPMFDQAYFDAHNPIELASGDGLAALGIYFDYGTADRYNRSVGLGAGLKKLNQRLTEAGVDHTFNEYAGEPHGWELVYTHLPDSLGFLAERLD